MSKASSHKRLDRSTIRRGLALIRPYAGLVVLTLILAVITVAPTLLAPVISGRAVDLIIGPGQVDFAGLGKLAVALAATILCTSVAQWLMNVINNRITFQVVRDIRVRAFEHLQALPLKYMDAHRPGDAISRITTDVEQFSDGLLMGQHVYIEPDHGQGQKQEGIHLPAYYINDADTSPWVWAQDKNGKLEKRSLTLGTYEEDLATYPVESGLAAEDYIAFPDETLAVGMTCVPYDQSTFEPDGSKTPDGSIDQPAMDGGLDLPEGGDGAVTDNTVTEG